MVGSIFIVYHRQLRAQRWPTSSVGVHRLSFFIYHAYTCKHIGILRKNGQHRLNWVVNRTLTLNNISDSLGHLVKEDICRPMEDEIGNARISSFDKNKNFHDSTIRVKAFTERRNNYKLTLLSKHSSSEKWIMLEEEITSDLSND